ncbi:hypothetical protein BZG36_01808 [Bifiguratus adelaidae]|uniref:[Histone H3]-trimethyl-L-lysine(4) demethylase n=1 Tax=Bifiguratus adelaidae TaxID=1938954 RepID=A0A261Y285_9FUNG|nr:hypothetical protein BZG36_01808 [Bifiguratus adelaidae]
MAAAIAISVDKTLGKQTPRQDVVLFPNKQRNNCQQKTHLWAVIEERVALEPAIDEESTDGRASEATGPSSASTELSVDDCWISIKCRKAQNNAKPIEKFKVNTCPLPESSGPPLVRSDTFPPCRKRVSFSNCPDKTQPLPTPPASLVSILKSKRSLPTLNPSRSETISSTTSKTIATPITPNYSSQYEAKCRSKDMAHLTWTLDLMRIKTNRKSAAENPPGYKRAFGLQDAKTYYPTPEEFTEPIKYIESIKNEAERYGIVKIIPPEGWRPDFSLDTEYFRFRTRIQKMNSMEGETRANLNYLEQLYKFHKQQGHPVNKIPQLDKRPIDLFRLKKEVASRGGYQRVTEQKKWAEIGRDLGYTRKQCTSMSNGLKSAYLKVILPYEIWLAKQPKLAAAIACATASTSSPQPSPDPAVKQEAEDKADEMDADGDVTMADGEEEKEEKADGKEKEGENGHLRRSRRREVSADSEASQASNHTSKSTDRSPSEKPSNDNPAKKARTLKDRSPHSPGRGDFCEICQGGQDDELILLCDECNRGYHIYCLTPALSSIPRTDWYCAQCLVGAGDDYGFEDGEEYSLHSFQQKCKQFKEEYFAKYMEDGELRVPEVEVEKEFWRLVENPHENIEVEYGADLHSTQHGSGFPSIERHPTNPYSTSPWNLNVLPVLPDSLFCHIKSDISGMTVPWLYVGMCFSTFCWHNEDHYTYSINYMHWGEAKTWYGIPASDALKFEETMKKAVPELFQQQPDLLFQLVTMLSPGTLLKEGVHCYAIDQRPNQFVVTFPQAYHGGFNHGFNFCEAVNFAPQDWTPFGLACAKRYKEYKKQPCFSHDELLVTTCLSDTSIQTAQWLRDALNDMAEREMQAREAFRKLYPNVREEVDTSERSEDQFQCVLCNSYCYLSQVSCSCTDKVTCSDHAADLCKCEMSKKVLRSRYSDEQVQEFAHRAGAIASVPDAWNQRLRKVMSENPRPSIKVLRSLLAEAEKIPMVIEAALSLKQFVDRANEWMEEANKLILRKHQNRRREKESSASAQDEQPPQKTPKHELAIRLMEEAEQFAFDAPEMRLLQESIRAMNEFRNKAQEVLANPNSTVADMREVYDMGNSLSCDLEEMDTLESKIKASDWLQEMEKDYKKFKDYGEVQRAVVRAREAGIAEDNPILKDLLTRKRRGKLWYHGAVKTLAKSHIEVAELEEIVDAAADPDVPIVTQVLAKAQQLAGKIKQWTTHVDVLLRQTAKDNLMERPPESELRSVLNALSKLPLEAAEGKILEMESEKVQAWSDQLKKTFFKFGGGKSNDQACEDLLVRAEVMVQAHKEWLAERTGDYNIFDQLPEDGFRERYCICLSSSDSGLMIQCENCHVWYHIVCVGVTRRQAKTKFAYVCPACDVDIVLPHVSTTPSYKLLHQVATDTQNIAFVPSDYPKLQAALDQVQYLAREMHTFVSSKPFFDLEDVPTIRHFLRIILGLRLYVTFPEEGVSFRSELRRLAPVDAKQFASTSTPTTEQLPAKKVAATNHVFRTYLDAPYLEESQKPAHANGNGNGNANANANAHKKAPNIKVYCLCRREYDEQEGGAMIQCDQCMDWYHLNCVNLTSADADRIPQYECPLCAAKNGRLYAFPQRTTDTDATLADTKSDKMDHRPTVIKLTVKPPQHQEQGPRPSPVPAPPQPQSTQQPLFGKLTTWPVSQPSSQSAGTMQRVHFYDLDNPKRMKKPATFIDMSSTLNNQLAEPNSGKRKRKEKEIFDPSEVKTARFDLTSHSSSSPSPRPQVAPPVPAPAPSMPFIQESPMPLPTEVKSERVDRPPSNAMSVHSLIHGENGKMQIPPPAPPLPVSDTPNDSRSLLPSTVEALDDYNKASPDKPFGIPEDKSQVSFSAWVDNREKRSLVLQTLLLHWKMTKKFTCLKGWRNELYTAYGDEQDPENVAFVLERAGAPLFGICQFGSQLNGYVKQDDTIKVWVAQRALTKQTWPGYYDTMVGGGIPYGQTPLECMVRECMEEASIPESLTKHLRATGTTSYFNYSADVGLCPEVLYIYDLELPATFVPTPLDGEVEAFELWTLDQVKQGVLEGLFLPAVGVAMIDFFVRWGYVTAETEPEYVALCAKLNRVSILAMPDYARISFKPQKK